MPLKMMDEVHCRPCEHPLRKSSALCSICLKAAAVNTPSCISLIWDSLQYDAYDYTRKQGTLGARREVFLARQPGRRLKVKPARLGRFRFPQNPKHQKLNPKA